MKKYYDKLIESRMYRNLAPVCGSKAFVFFFCGILGAVAFIRIFGVTVLDFTYTDWLIHQGPGGSMDLTQHFMGWRFYRNSAWYFPIGMMDNIVHPYMLSVVYTDSIPLFAVFFKILSPLLPESFQYFGLFGITCFILQGAVAGLIMKRLCKNTVYAIIGSVFFILSVTMILRVFAHTALSAHFILLLCIYVCITKGDTPEARPVWKHILIWGGLMSLSVATQSYFAPMVMIFMAFYALDDCFKNKKIVPPLAYSAGSMAMVCAVMFCLGVFHGDVASGYSDLGQFGANLFTMFTPMGMSNFMPEQPVATSGQYEGFAYLGLGIIVGLIFVIVHLIKDKPLKEYKLYEIVLFALLFISFVIVAVSPLVAFRGRILFVYPLPGLIIRIWEIVRSTGRFIWVPAYIVGITVIYSISRCFKPKIAVLILSLLLVIQVLDIGSSLLDKGKPFTGTVEYQSQMQSGAWDELGTHNGHVMFLGRFISDYDIVFPVADFAADYGLTINDFYLTRVHSLANADKETEKQRLTEGYVREGTIYILYTGFWSKNHENLSGLDFYRVDGFLVGIKAGFAFENNDVISVEDGGDPYFAFDEDYAITGLGPAALEMSNYAFVDMLFDELLGRSTDPAGESAYIGRLENGESRESIMNEFLSSEEYING